MIDGYIGNCSAIKNEIFSFAVKEMGLGLFSNVKHIRHRKKELHVLSHM